MSAIKDYFQKILAPIKPLPAGMYQYLSPQDDPRNYRLHLRIEEEGNGVLLINGSTILHINQTAAEYAYYLIKNLSPNEVGQKMNHRYNIDRSQAVQDYLDFSDRIQVLINTPDLDPVTFLDFDRKQPYSGNIQAPYRLDCALTYALPEGNSANNPLSDRVYRELSTGEWFTIFDKAWQAGIPHIVLTGGEATTREDLPELIAHAEKNGQITGLLTDGMRLQDKAYIRTLLDTGLDHLMFIHQPTEEKCWSALENAIEEDIYVAVHLTIHPGEIETILSTIHQLHALGVKAVSLSTSTPDLKNDLDQTRELLASLKIDLIWNLPVPYSNLNPVHLEIPKAPELAGRAWLYVEPDGDVLPAQGVQKVAGNFLTDDWEKIRKNLPL